MEARRRARRYTDAQLAVMKEWQDHTGFEFMFPGSGESFATALKRNKEWFRTVYETAMRIGETKG
jgi:hypothetical protein